MREAFGEYWEQGGADSSGGSVYPRSLHYDGGDLISIDAWGNFSKIRTVEKSKQWLLGKELWVVGLGSFCSKLFAFTSFPSLADYQLSLLWISRETEVGLE
jgi:hypothetical protein